jgi:hypothetical protein
MPQLQPECIGFIFGPWSQTTGQWPLTRLQGEVQVTIECGSNSADSPSIVSSRQEQRDDLIKEIMVEYKGAWERLAAL